MKSPESSRYHDLYKDFSWDVARSALDGLPHGRGINIAHEAVDRHANSTDRKNRTAIIFCSSNMTLTNVTYSELANASNRFANGLKRLGIAEGDTVFCLMGRIPELYVSCFGTLKIKAIFSPLFSAFGPEPIRTRLALGKAKVLITTYDLFTRKIKQIRPHLPELRHIIITSPASFPESSLPAGTIDFRDFLAKSDPHFEILPTSPQQAALLHFTSGTTGYPKGVLHVHDAITTHHATAKLVFGLRQDDIFWCSADPGWVTGTSYGIIAPLSHGISMLVDEGEFDATRWYQILENNKITIWYTAPTAIRMLMKAGDELPRDFDLKSLRLIASVGEALNPEAVIWSEKVFGFPIRDNWWQTETGGIMIANLPDQPVKPGSMGRPVPGIEAAIVEKTNGQNLRLLTTPNTQGELALRVGWPSMFQAYLSQPDRYAKCFINSWYLTGDLAKVDSDGYFWFIGRIDDLIKSAGHLVGPFEVENILMEHPAVTEAAVIGKPDPVLGESIKAFVSLKSGYIFSEELKREILALTRKRLGSGIAPRDIECLPNLPKTRSGKILRRLLKSRELGLSEGDISTLDSQ